MDVPTIRLSKSQIDDLGTVCSIGADGLTKLAKAINAVKPTISRAQILEIITKQVGADKTPAFRRVLFSLATLARRAFKSTDEIISGISATLATSGWTNQQQETWRESQRALAQVLGTQSLVLATKARDISTDFERVYVGSRILTDIRPVFEEPDKAHVVGAVIVQSFRLDFITSDAEQGSITVALDSKDLIQLKGACDKAIEKARVSKEFIKDKVETLTLGEETE